MIAINNIEKRKGKKSLLLRTSVFVNVSVQVLDTTGVEGRRATDDTVDSVTYSSSY